MTQGPEIRKSPLRRFRTRHSGRMESLTPEVIAVTRRFRNPGIAPQESLIRIYHLQRTFVQALVSAPDRQGVGVGLFGLPV